VKAWFNMLAKKENCVLFNPASELDLPKVAALAQSNPLGQRSRHEHGSTGT